MSILLSRSKHEEFESNSALQIINQKERTTKEVRKMKPTKKIAQGAKFLHHAKIDSIICDFWPLLTSGWPTF